LQVNGLALRERGTGFVVMAGNGTAVKASSIDPNCSKAKLERRFGAYEPPGACGSVDLPAKTYEKKPLPCRVDTTALYARYQQAQQQASALGAAERAAVRAGKEREIEAVKQRARLKRASIKLLTRPGLARRLLYQGASKTLRDQTGRICEAYRQQREAISSRYQRRTWVDWLRAEAMAGDRVALAALRARATAPRLPGNTVGGTRCPADARVTVPCDGITKNGTVIYRFGSTAVRDDGDKLTVSRGATDEGLQAALRMATQRYGPLLRVGGTADFRAKIVQAAVGARLAVRFDDVLLECRRQTLLEQVSARIGDRYQAEAVLRQSSAQSRLGRNGVTETAMRRGSGRHRTGP
jgi:hypothetical protein